MVGTRVVSKATQRMGHVDRVHAIFRDGRRLDFLVVIFDDGATEMMRTHELFPLTKPRYSAADLVWLKAQGIAWERC
jgi:hypothetical protein